MAFLAALVALLACGGDPTGPALGVARAISGELPRLSGPLVHGPGSLDPIAVRGRITVVNFWATWCAPCREEQPVLQSLWRDVRDEGVAVVGVNYRDDPAAARAWVREFGVGYPSVSDPDGSYAADFGFTGLPATYVADERGQLRYRFYGAVTRSALERVLAELRPDGG
jgi:cytochrome c biogenesis protein CcmG, thiol:disulfide interchange protein DsbE